jgi:hypothetical protein
MGLTVSDSGRVKPAVLRLKGHPVLQQIGDRLAASEPHYVLLVHGKPSGLGGGARFEKTMGTVHADLRADVDARFRSWAAEEGERPLRIPSLPSPRQCWYAYWNGHLDHHFRIAGLPDPFASGEYVGIRRRRS